MCFYLIIITLQRKKSQPFNINTITYAEQKQKGPLRKWKD